MGWGLLVGRDIVNCSRNTGIDSTCSTRRRFGDGSSVASLPFCVSSARTRRAASRSSGKGSFEELAYCRGHISGEGGHGTDRRIV